MTDEIEPDLRQGFRVFEGLECRYVEAVVGFCLAVDEVEPAMGVGPAVIEDGLVARIRGSQRLKVGLGQAVADNNVGKR